MASMNPTRRALLATPLFAANGQAVIELEDWLNASIDDRRRAVQDCLRRIRETDSSVRAWVHVKPEKSAGNGPLAGIPCGVKDVIEVRGLAYELGSPIYRGQRATSDAVIVAKLKALGAVILGKTHTAAFAHTTPPITRNPRNLEHTPGGSSSGSAAAVAAGMVPFALGTQTGGSVLRPASYCGVTGFKPTFGVLPTGGVMEYARSLDTLGLFTHTPQGMLRLWEALGQAVGRATVAAIGAVDPLPAGVEPPMAEAFRLASARLRTQPVSIAPMLEELLAESRIVSYYEGARAHAERYRLYGARLQELGAMVEEGLKISDARSEEAMRHIAEGTQRRAEVYKTTPIVILPAATGPAPRGLASTGDSRMNRVWTALGTPSISIPMSVGAALPLGLQLTAAPGNDALLLHVAVRAAELTS